MKMKVKYNLPDFVDMQKQLKLIADRVIIPDIAGRMNSRRDLGGRTYAPLALSTIKQKQKKGLRTEPLLATGQLRRSFKSRLRRKNAVVITPAGTRYSIDGGEVITNKELANILQNEGVETKRGKRFFEFFGISKEAEIESIDFMEKYIKREIRRGRRKFIR